MSKFAPKGAPDRPRLERMALTGQPARDGRRSGPLDRNDQVLAVPMGHRADGSATTQRLRSSSAPREAIRTCPRHGSTPFVLESRGSYRCKQCRLEQVSRWRRRLKAKLVTEAGGQCVLCGYDRCQAALQFHHLDPETKSFSLSHEAIARSLARSRAEAQKCVLLCANCHAEVEAGVSRIEAA